MLFLVKFRGKTQKIKGKRKLYLYEKQWNGRWKVMSPFSSCLVYLDFFDAMRIIGSSLI
jgi:hypothetical protein